MLRLLRQKISFKNVNILLKNIHTAHITLKLFFATVYHNINFFCHLPQCFAPIFFLNDLYIILQGDDISDSSNE